MSQREHITHLRDLTSDPANRRRHSPRGVGMIEKALGEVGAARSIVIDENGVVLAGNATIEAAAQAGIERVQVVDGDGETVIAVRRSGLTDDQKRKLAMYDNRTGELSDWNADQLLADVAAGIDLEQFFRKDELDEILRQAEGYGQPADDPGADNDRAAELQEKWGTALGQLWQIGRHRLLCGDCTVRENVERVMGGELAACMWTDPPYGVDYVGKTKDALTIENDGIADLPGLLTAAFMTATDVLQPGAPFYVAHPPGARHLVFWTVIDTIGWQIHQELIWVKDSMVLGHSDYHYKHEPILYGFTPGPGRSGRGKHEGTRWRGDHSQVSVFEIPRPKRSEEHPTMKPPELVIAMLRNSTIADDVVYDPFLGSGTTLVACEQLGRSGRGLEISPAYCAVILDRLSGMGLKPELVS